MYENISQAINDGLEILKESKMRGCHTNVDITELNDTQEHTRHDDELLQKQKARIEDLKTLVQTLYDQLHTKNDFKFTANSRHCAKKGRKYRKRKKNQKKEEKPEKGRKTRKRLIAEIQNSEF